MSPRKLPADPYVAGQYPDQLEVRRVGLGWVGALMPAGVALSVDRIVQSRGEFSGELTVERAPEGHIFVGRFNLSDVGERRRTADYLGGRTNSVDWVGTLEQLCLAVLTGEREGRPFEELGHALDPQAEPRWILRPLLVEGRPNVIYGEGGVGKSTLAAAAAVSCATGVDVVEGWHPVGRTGVLVVDWEADREEWEAHIAAICKGRGLDRPVIHYRPGAGPLTDQLDEVAQYAAENEVGLLVIDSVGLAMPSRAEGADANEGALKLFGALRLLGLTSLLIDHVAGADMGKEGVVAKPYGSVYKFNLARNLFELRAVAPVPGDEVSHQRLALHHRKSNRGPKVEPLGFGIERGPGELVFRAEPLVGVEARVGLTVPARILAYLDEVGVASSQEICDELGIDQGARRTAMSRLVRADQVIEQPGGTPRNQRWALPTRRRDGPVPVAPARPREDLDVPDW